MVKAIDHATGIHVQVRTFEVHSVSVGEDAQGEALLTVKHNGRTYRGAGISTNILEAAARMYLESSIASKPRLPARTEVVKGVAFS